MSSTYYSPRLPELPAQRPPVILSAAALTDACQTLLIAAGVRPQAAALVADSLVASNLRGIDSHGIQLITTYLGQLKAGGVDPRAVGRVVSDSGACLLYDAENSLGQVSAQRCVEEVLRMVRSSGIAIVVAKRANHFGAGAYWADQIVAAGCFALVQSNACPAVAPWQGNSPRFGTNPFCASAPSAGSFPWTLDMATTTVALGKLGDATFRGERTIPDWWGFLDKADRPTTSTQEALEGKPSPFGRYKGSGIAMMVELLTAGLSGGPMSTQIPAFGLGSTALDLSHSFIAIDPRRFLGTDDYAQRTEQLTRIVKSAEPAPGYQEVLVAGEPEWRTTQVRGKEGIPVPAALWEKLQAAGTELGVTL